jgi:Cys-tRNA(Pro)/Cys-tRNA(Cys) deacylase
MKTNAMRIRDTLGIHYEIREYEVAPDDLRAERIAGDIGLPPEQGKQMVLAPDDYLRATQAAVGPISRLGGE